jgi:hypothetical protein
MLTFYQARDILDDVIYNIIYDIVGKVHREEKVARANTASVLARDLAEKELAAREAAATENGDNDQAGVVDNKEADNLSLTVETDGAIYQNGQVFLRGNPLETVKEIICPDCRLPRLLYPFFGEGARPVPESNREYCRKRPAVRLPGRDVHGRPYAIEKATKKKKTAASPSPPSSPSTPHAATASLEQLPGKTFVPSVKCPNCPRYFFLTRIAQHLDRCVGISTRSSRNRTPLESGLSTPVPQAASAAGVTRKRIRGPDGEEEAVPTPNKKKKKPAGPSKLRNMAEEKTTKGD